MEEAGWSKLCGYSIYPWSIGGVFTTVVIMKDDLKLAFDMGDCCRQSIPCNHVFISHGHMDHISSIPQHSSRRELFGMKKASYYVPDHLLDLVKEVASTFHQINVTDKILDNLDVRPVTLQDKIKVARAYFVCPFPTVHRVPSQGYILYRRQRTMKDEYKHLEGPEIALKAKERVELYNYTEIPDIAYTGDTTFELFLKSPHPDLLKVKILIVETTYIDEEPGKDIIRQARDRGHIHLAEIIDNAHLFENVQHILLMHFSDKYSENEITDKVFSILPESLKKKVLVATIAKRLY
ncbi:hypothetical protein CHS0354_031593 [Potamilus streckersoni]|uniref:Uncharacterized protein n=1 Tax=Potamilus streckersoni TaxID=2493646 RepID=A0AAE0SG96_9BIVA|nr:hypothetical protein CHS0354_031593 [Potamilus streckersoni]